MLNIIHLPEREDRLATLFRELKTQNITKYTLWNGVKHDFSFTGIRMAHQNIVLHAKQSGLEQITIAEDDIMFLGEGAYEYYISEMEKCNDFDIFLGGIMNGETEQDNTIKYGYFTGLTLYTINQRFYDKFLSIRKVGNIDALLRGMGRFVLCNPMVVSQHGGLSDNKGVIVESYAPRLEGRNLYKSR